MKKQSKLRKEAKGRECMIRIPGVCNKRNETVVLCHLNNKSLFGAGVGMKVPDLFGAWGCSACHDVVDGRKDCGFLRSQQKEMFTDGVFRTQNQLLKEGKFEF